MRGFSQFRDNSVHLFKLLFVAAIVDEAQSILSVREIDYESDKKRLNPMTLITEISSDERKRVAELRSIVGDLLSDYYNTDFNLLRWIQGHGTLPTEEIARKLRHHLLMRKSSWNVDEKHLPGQPLHPINAHWLNGMTDLAGGALPNTIVFVEQCGRIDYSGMLECYSLNEVMKARIVVLEQMLCRCMEIEKKTGKQASILFVMDLSDLEYNKKLYDLVTGKMKELAEFMADHYVELIKYFVLVNVPAFVYLLWTAVRPLLPERTKNKVRILSSNWRSEITELCDPDSCPSYWSDENHRFNADVQFPKPFPIEHYGSAQSTPVPSGLDSFDVSAGKTKKICKRMQKGDKLHYWFTANRNVGFGISINEESTSEATTDDLYIEPQLVPTYHWLPGPLILPIEDTVEVPVDGVYTIWFSNQKSWWSSVHVKCKIDVTSN